MSILRNKALTGIVTIQMIKELTGGAGSGKRRMKALLKRFPAKRHFRR